MTIGIIVIELCDGNYAALLAFEDLEKEFPEVAVLRDDCLGRCGLCRVRPFALVNGQQVFANTTDELVQRVRDIIVQELAFYQ